MLIQRGEIYALDFDALDVPMTKKRPAVVIQNDAANEFSPNTIVAAIHHENKKGLPFLVSIPQGTAGLTKDSVVDAGCITTIPQKMLGNKIGALSYEIMDKVDSAIKVSLDLS